MLLESSLIFLLPCEEKELFYLFQHPEIKYEKSRTVTSFEKMKKRKKNCDSFSCFSFETRFRSCGVCFILFMLFSCLSFAQSSPSSTFFACHFILLTLTRGNFFDITFYIDVHFPLLIVSRSLSPPSFQHRILCFSSLMIFLYILTFFTFSISSFFLFCFYILFKFFHIIFYILFPFFSINFTFLHYFTLFLYSCARFELLYILLPSFHCLLHSLQSFTSLYILFTFFYTLFNIFLHSAIGLNFTDTCYFFSGISSYSHSLSLSSS